METKMKKNWMIKSFGVLTIAIATLMSTGCGRVVPPGTTVLILTPSGQSTIKHEGVYRAYGRDRLYFVDTKLKSYAKSMQVLCSDDINMSVNIKWVGSFKVTDATIDVIKSKVPARKTKRGDISGFELSLDDFYKTAMQDFISNITRSIISKYKTDNIREHRDEIRTEIKKRILDRIKELKYPVSTADVLITNLDYPPEVTAMRKSIKKAELQDLENAAIAKAEVSKARRNAEIEAEKGKAKLVEAEADAAANRVRSSSLTPAILAVKQLETLVKLAAGPNNNTVIIPFDAIRPGLDQTMIQREGIQQIVNTVKNEKNKSTTK